MYIDRSNSAGMIQRYLRQCTTGLRTLDSRLLIDDLTDHDPFCGKEHWENTQHTEHEHTYKRLEHTFSFVADHMHYINT